MSEPISVWAIETPEWASSPPFFIDNNSVRRRRAAAQAYIGDVWANVGETPMQGWKRAYREGYRAVRVQITKVDE